MFALPNRSTRPQQSVPARGDRDFRHPHGQAAAIGGLDGIMGLRGRLFGLA